MVLQKANRGWPSIVPGGEDDDAQYPAPGDGSLLRVPAVQTLPHWWLSDQDCSSAQQTPEEARKQNLVVKRGQAGW